MDLKTKIALGLVLVILTIGGVIYALLPPSGIPGNTACVRGICRHTTQGCMVLTGKCSNGSCLEALKSGAECAAGWQRETIEGEARQVWTCNASCQWELAPAP